VQRLNRRPVWHEAALSVFIGMCLGGFVIGIGNAVNESGTAAAVIVGLLLAAWGSFLLKQGMTYRASQGAVVELGRQYCGAAAGFLTSAIIIACGVVERVF
jgi:hypothetical protein